MKHLKRLISALLLTAVLATAVFASAATIKDVPAKNWAYPYVSKMVDMEIMQTHDGGYFYPDLPTSRGSSSSISGGLWMPRPLGWTRALRMCPGMIPGPGL